MSRTSEDLSAYLDGELTEVEARALEKELSKNAALMAELTELREAQDFMRVHGPSHAPPDFYNNILSALEHEAMDRSWWSWFARPFGIPIQGVAIAAIAALVLVFTIPFNTTSLLTPITGQKSGMRAKSMELSSLKSYEKEPETETTQQPETISEPGRVSQGSPADNSLDKDVRPTKMSKKSAGKKDVLLQQLAGDATGSAEGLEENFGSRGPEKSATEPKKEKKIAARSNGYQYIIETTDINAAYTLNALVARHAGSLVDSGGRNVSPNALQAGDTEVFQVYLDEDAINAFDRQLGTIGSVRRSIPKGMDLTSGGNRRLEVVIRIIDDTDAITNTIQFDANIPNQETGAKDKVRREK